MASLSRIAERALRLGARELVKAGRRQARAAAKRSHQGAPPRSTPPERGAAGYPGDFTGVASIRYEPRDDGKADPGEVVWAWVPYEEDHAQGKDRPALVIGLDGPWLLALPLTSKDHDRDADQEERAGRFWIDIGSGAWDSRGRPSEVRLDRIVRLDPSTIRRQGSHLDRGRFDEVAAALRAQHGWS